LPRGDENVNTKTLLVVGLVGLAIYMYFRSRTTSATGASAPASGTQAAAGANSGEAWSGAAASAAGVAAQGLLHIIFPDGSRAPADSDININAD
jgi:hypothetical protein